MLSHGVADGCLVMVGVTVVGIAVGQRVLVGVIVTGVAVGQRVFVADGIGEGRLVRVAVGGNGVGEGPKVGVGVRVGVAVRVGVGVRVGVEVGEGDGVRVLVVVMDGVGLGGGVGASPSTRKRPEIFHVEPTKIRTSYSPGCHSQGWAFQSENPKPPDPPSHGLLSKNTRSSPRYHKALHCEPSSMPSSAEQRIHMPNRILENLARVERLVGFLINAFTEDQLAEDRIRVGCYLAFEILLDFWR